MGVGTVIGLFESTQIRGREQFFDNLPSREGIMAGAWSDDGQKFSFARANLIRKYGKDWENGAWQSAERRLRAWVLQALVNGRASTRRKTGQFR
jgi:hypothetical protein